MSRYVRSKYSEQAQLWKLPAFDPWNDDMIRSTWRTIEDHLTCVYLPKPEHILTCVYLPKSEYIEVPAPKMWTDVTKQCEEVHRGGKDAPLGSGHFLTHDGRDLAQLICGGAYRLRKVTFAGPGNLPSWAFIVEKRS